VNALGRKNVREARANSFHKLNRGGRFQHQKNVSRQ
jgi:hypothetical protein